MRNKDLYNTALKYSIENPYASFQDIVNVTGVSRATAYNAIKEARGIRPENTSEGPLKVIKSCGVTISTLDPNSMLPGSLENVTEFEHEGEISETPDVMDGKLVWDAIEFTSFCPCCGKRLNYLKNSVCFSHSGKREVVQTFHGFCRKCSMSTTMQRSRK